MTTKDYRDVLISSLERIGQLETQRMEIDVELSKLNQFVAATSNMLPDDQRKEFADALDNLAKESEVITRSLTESIRKILQSSSSDWFTVAHVRNRLVASGFDFSGYTANPLASISTTLKRMKPDEVENSLIAGVTVYRWKGAGEVPSSTPPLPILSSSKGK